jgi:NAD(P)-dependent dehydrogenase (short-subunit alcohol dehydrogenase family)
MLDVLKNISTEQNETFCAQLVQAANRMLGGLDLVVNNAG